MARLTRPSSVPWHIVTSLVLVGLLVTACGAADDEVFYASDPDAATVPIDSNGFPLDWPVAKPRGSVTDCPNGQVSQLQRTFSVVLCLPDDPDPLTVAEAYLDELRAEGFAEREPGAFAIEQQTFLDGNGIEVYFQLIGDEATIVLVRAG